MMNGVKVSEEVEEVEEMPTRPEDLEEPAFQDLPLPEVLREALSTMGDSPTTEAEEVGLAVLKRAASTSPTPVK